MADQIRSFPFTEPSVGKDDRAVSEYADLMEQKIGELARGYEQAHQDVADMVAATEDAELIYHSTSQAMADDFWHLLEAAGIAHRGRLFDLMLQRVMVWCGIAAWQAFVMGREVKARTALNQMLEGMDLGEEVDGLE